MDPIIKNYRDHENPVLDKKDGVPNYVMLYVQHGPNESSPLHTHAWEHQAFITEGSGVLYFGGKEFPIKQGDCVHVPGGVEHQFRNTESVPMNRVTVNNDPTAHGEITAIRQACKKLGTFDLNGYELYSNCEPCPMCLSAIYWSHIEKVYYANTRDDAHNIDFLDPIIYAELQKNSKERKIPMVQIMREEGLKAFEIWDKKTDKIKY